MTANTTLIVTGRTGERSVFALDTSLVRVGRGATSDVCLKDAKVSRSHAQIDLSGEAPVLTDLGSSNGTWVNEQRVTRGVLGPGDSIRIGDSTLRLEATGSTAVDAPAEAEGHTVIDTEADLDRTLAESRTQMTLNETQAARLAITTPGRTWEVTFRGDALSLGRHAENDIALDLPKVSRRHARVERRGDEYILRDLESTNGTWMGERRIDTRALRDGDCFRIGPATLTLKLPFTEEDLTLLDAPTARTGARRPVVFVPGFFGSELYRGSERVWPNIPQLLRDPRQLRPDAPLEARRIVGEVVIVPNLITQEKYDRMGDFLEEALGYERGKDLLEVPYDWRQDNRASAAHLARTIDDWQAATPEANQPITLIAHSMGCLVSRWYIEKLGGHRKIDRLILVGGPHYGTPKIIFGLFTGRGVLPFGLMGEKLRQLLSAMPAAYQLLPTRPCVEDRAGNPIDVLADESWMPPEARHLVRDARQFRRDLGMRSSVPTTSIFGYGLKTQLKLVVDRDDKGSWLDVKFDMDARGDDTIPEWSAVLDGSDIHPVRQRHGALYVDGDVKMRLKIELGRKP